MKIFRYTFTGESNHIWLKIRWRRLHAPYLKLIAGKADITEAVAIMAQSAFLSGIIQATTSLSTHPLQSSIIDFTESISIHVENPPVSLSDLKGRRS